MSRGNQFLSRLASCFVLCALLFMTVSPAAADTVTPSPCLLLDQYIPGGDSFTFREDSRIFLLTDTEPADELQQTAALIHRQFAASGIASARTPLVWGTAESLQAGDLVLRLDPAAGEDGYILEIGSTAQVTGGDTDGLLYGADMLLKCFLAEKTNTLAGFRAADTPDTAQRAVMLDTGRKYFTAQWICNFIRQISWMGYNALELHFSEDGGFRADFWDPAYYTDAYRPENDFTWLCGSHIQSWVKDPYRTDPDAGKYLTAAELVQICEVAAEYHIEIIPSFDSPAHMDYITWQFEQNAKADPDYSFTYRDTVYTAAGTGGCINYTGMTGAASPAWPYYTTIDITEGSTARAFVLALYEDIAGFFREYGKSTHFNIGGDEVNLSEEYGPLWDYSQFPGYVNTLNRLLNEKGYTVRMFNDFIGSSAWNDGGTYDFDDNIEILYWNSPFRPNTGEYTDPVWRAADFAAKGYTLYNCIMTNCYYVLRTVPPSSSYPSMDARNPDCRYWTFYHSTEEAIYNEWQPADMSERGDFAEDAAPIPENRLGGAYFLIWNDYAALNTEAEIWNGVPDGTGTAEYVYSLFDRMASNSIKMWNCDINKTVSYSEFAAVRDSIGYFPGYTACSDAPSMPQAPVPVPAVLPDSAPETALPETTPDETGNKPDSLSPDDPGNIPGITWIWIPAAVGAVSAVCLLAGALSARRKLHRRQRR